VDRCRTITNADLGSSHNTEEVRPSLLKESFSEMHTGADVGLCEGHSLRHMGMDSHL